MLKTACKKSKMIETKIFFLKKTLHLLGFLDRVYISALRLSQSSQLSEERSQESLALNCAEILMFVTDLESDFRL